MASGRSRVALHVLEDRLLEALPHLLGWTAGPVEEGAGEELVGQVREPERVSQDNFPRNRCVARRVAAPRPTLARRQCP